LSIRCLVTVVNGAEDSDPYRHLLGGLGVLDVPSAFCSFVSCHGLLIPVSGIYSAYFGSNAIDYCVPWAPDLMTAHDFVNFSHWHPC
jgi:hypothetical protein